MMILPDELALLRWQLSFASRLADHHLPALTDEACFWMPVPNSWTVRQGEGGLWRPDWAEEEPDPAPATTIAWLSRHLIWWLSDLMASIREQPRTPREQCFWPGSAQAAAEHIQSLLGQWQQTIVGLQVSDLTKPVNYPWPEPRELRQVIAWANVELTKNIAEIGVLRHAFEASRRSMN
ncbi:MAG: DinB family protein [Caulobacteraceae bacterium]